ncbi:hypothetical protein BDP27DRAFT_1335988 [Rhodocollybia butyracea]|uniref:F-box domain-containing protein n=1 Tax=Rhodocollybia butyracea TaxID=206335 RepID=A0A9P5PGK6_9AGAR|nr:hypothetical protein BDP27DRAFT_1335988 [Rhodocollybia butyracea]
MFLASHAVLRVPELLDRILCLVDIRSLLLAAQLVCHDWYNLIIHSPSIQQALHLRPRRNTGGERIQNAFLAELFPPWFDNDKAGAEGYKPHEFLRMALASNRDVLLKENPTLDRMLVAQPPVLRVGIWKKSHDMRRDGHKFEMLEFPNGLRMGEFYEVGQKQLLEAVSDFRVVWDMADTKQLKKGKYGRELEVSQMKKMLRLARKVDVMVVCSRFVRSVGV